MDNIMINKMLAYQSIFLWIFPGSGFKFFEALIIIRLNYLISIIFNWIRLYFILLFNNYILILFYFILFIHTRWQIILIKY